MSVNAVELIARYAGRTDLGSGARHLVAYTRDYPGVTAEQVAQLQEILRANPTGRTRGRRAEEPRGDAKTAKLQEFADQEASIAERELTATLNVALTAAGASDEADLEEARAILRRKLLGDRSPLVIAERVEQLKARFPQLFGGPARETPTPAVHEPERRRGVPKGQPGEHGSAYARSRGWID